ncbi:MAG: hypothetical protein ACR2MY_03330 [Candidatus Dormibacteria bacterium]
MSESTQGTVAGSFATYAEAQKAVGALEQAGFSASEIGVLRKGEENGHTDGPDHVHPAVGVGTGAVEGGLLGAAAAFLIPGAGPVIGAGILGLTVLGALTGAATGGIAGALTHAGFSKDDADHYGQAFEQGHTIVTVRAAGREAEAQAILTQHSAGTRPAAVEGTTTV